MQYKESENLELKSSFSEWKEIIITLSAFANKNGGMVVVGLDDNGISVNLQIGKRTIEDFVNKIKNCVDPILYPSINVKTFGLGEIVEIKIPKSDNKPVFAFERAYVRVGKTNQKLSQTEIKALIKRYDLPDFDKRYFNKAVSAIELDKKLIKEVGRKYHIKFKSSIDFLNKLELISKNKITYAGYLCFVKQNFWMINAIVKAARFKGKSMEKFIDMKDFDANIISATDEIIDFIKRHINMEVIISGKARRDEVWDYPLPALREAIINALIHRDYADSGNIQIRIFDDRLEIWSPGLLPKKLDIKKILSENRSVPRNKILVGIFHKIGLIESWGTGFQRIVSECLKNNNKKPDFSEKAGAFVVGFYKRDKNGGVNGGVSGGVNGGVSGGVNNILTLIKENPGINSKSIAERLDVAPRTVERHIKKFRDDDIIEYRGSAKIGGYWAMN